MREIYKNIPIIGTGSEKGELYNGDNMFYIYKKIRGVKYEYHPAKLKKVTYSDGSVIKFIEK
jgi:hypothetical protein